MPTNNEKVKSYMITCVQLNFSPQLMCNCLLFSVNLMFKMKQCQVQNVLFITLTNAVHVIDRANSFL